MKTYQVTITETLQMTVDIKAENPAQAEQIARDGYRDYKYVLDTDHFEDVQFDAKLRQKNRDVER